MRFKTVPEFVKYARSKPYEELVRVHKNPFLVQRDRFRIQPQSQEKFDANRTGVIDVDTAALEDVSDEGAEGEAKAVAEEPIRVIELDGPEFSIGRNPACTICIPDASVSARHATLLRTRMGYRVIDHGSTNGTFVGAVRLQAETPLPVPDGKILAVASNRFRFFLPETFLGMIEKMVQKIGGRS